MTGSRPWDPDDPWDPDRIVSPRAAAWLFADEPNPDDRTSNACGKGAHHECLLDTCSCRCHADEEDDDGTG